MWSASLGTMVMISIAFASFFESCVSPGEIQNMKKYLIVSYICGPSKLVYIFFYDRWSRNKMKVIPKTFHSSSQSFKKFKKPAPWPNTSFLIFSKIWWFFNTFFRFSRRKLWVRNVTPSFSESLRSKIWKKNWGDVVRREYPSPTWWETDYLLGAEKEFWVVYVLLCSTRI